MFDTELHLLDDVLGSETHRFKVIVLFLLPDPSDTLDLGVNHEGITHRVGQNGSIFSGDSIGGETLFVPTSDHRLVGQKLNGVYAGGSGDVVFVQVSEELVINNQLTILFVERAGVGNESRCHQDVSSQETQIRLELNDRVTPTFIFGSQGLDESLGEIQTIGATGRFSHGCFFDRHSFVVFGD